MTPNAAELAELKKTASVVSSKPVLSALIHALQTADPAAPETLIDAIRAEMPYDYCGYLQLGFNETQYLLNISLSLVSKDYVASIDVPNEQYAAELYKQYDLIKVIAIAYWRQFVADHAELIDKIRAILPEIGELTVDPNSPTTMYFDYNSSKRVGIFAYYVTADGSPIGHK
jgi:hypothetical protein